MNYHFILALITLLTQTTVMGIAQKSLIFSDYYLSHSPYYTIGYLGAQAERRGALYGPNPYNFDRTISEHPPITSRREWRKKNISRSIYRSER